MAPVIIAGAGPAGAALSYLLARRGIEVVLVERHTDFGREFRGEVLMPSGVDALAQMGLGDALALLPQVRPTLVDLHVNGRFVTRLDAGAIVGAGPCMVSQPAMLEMLVERCSRFGGFRLLRGTTVGRVLYQGDRVTGVVLRGAAAGDLEGRLVVGCDGRWSLVRREAGLDTERHDEAFDVIWFKVPMPGWLAAAGHPVQIFLRPGQACGAFAAFDGRLQVAWIVRKGSFGEIKARGLDAWLEQIARVAGPDLGRHLLAHRAALERPFVLDVVCYLLDRWHRPGVLLLGDAAHPMSPVGGQGLNLALRDAIVAANHLVPVLERGGAPQALDEAAAAIQAERHPEAREVQRLQRIPPRLFFRRGPGIGVLLTVAAHLLRSAAVRRGLRPPRMTRVFLHGVRSVRLEV